MQVDDRLTKLRLRREVVVETALSHVGGLAQLVDADRLIAALEKQARGRRDYALAGV
jgi:hypothetical protein